MNRPLLYVCTAFMAVSILLGHSGVLEAKTTSTTPAKKAAVKTVQKKKTIKKKKTAKKKKEILNLNPPLIDPNNPPGGL